MQDEYAENHAGERLRASIDGRGWTLATFSRRSGVPYRSIQDYIAGKSKPGFEQLAKFSEAGIDIAYVLTGKSANSRHNDLPQFIEFGDGFGVGKYPFHETEVEKFLTRLPNGFELRDWIDIWNICDDRVVSAKEFKIDEVKRQGVVVVAAFGILLSVIERMKALGWIAR